mmetsp:Transcript_20135/g.39557  ORF Transcript_20135/g.39557 Transcript_20135/m.39557 type:complete len:101 (+) Transcript_20135:1914-2216(+)
MSLHLLRQKNSLGAAVAAVGVPRLHHGDLEHSLRGEVSGDVDPPVGLVGDGPAVGGAGSAQIVVENVVLVVGVGLVGFANVVAYKSFAEYYVDREFQHCW